MSVSALLNQLMFMPIAPWPAGAATVAPSDSASAQLVHGCGALLGYRQRLYVPVGYFSTMISLTGVYVGAIFKMDDIACRDTVECRGYSKLEWAFSQSAAMETLNTWTPQGRAAMALSAGLHIFSSFLFAQLFIYGALALRERFEATGDRGLTKAASAVPYMGRLFTALYLAAQCANAAIIVGGDPNKATPVAVGVLLIISFVLLALCVLFIVCGGAYAVVDACLVRTPRATKLPLSAMGQTAHPMERVPDAVAV